MLDLETVMQEACGTGELISVIYYGGSQPGARRELQPMRVNPPYVYAFCHHAEEFRTFRLDKMRLADGSAVHAPAYVRRPSEKRGRQDRWHFQDFGGHIALSMDEAEWHVDVSGLEIAVYPRFKNGKPRRTPVLRLTREPHGFVLRAKDLGTRSFRYLDAAAARAFQVLGLPPHEPQSPPQSTTPTGRLDVLVTPSRSVEPPKRLPPAALPKGPRPAPAPMRHISPELFRGPERPAPRRGLLARVLQFVWWLVVGWLAAGLLFKAWRLL